MAEPIKQHLVESWDIYSIVYGSGNSKEKIPLNPRYLIPLLKNDKTAIASYSGPIEQTYETNYASYGDLKYTLTIEVIENEMSLSDFIEKVLLKKYSVNNHSTIQKLLSLSACTKSLILSVIYLLYVSDDDNILFDLSELDNISELYKYTLNKLNSMMVEENPVKLAAANYIPKIESEDFDFSKLQEANSKYGYAECNIWNTLHVESSSQHYNDKKYLTGTQLALEEIEIIDEENQGYLELFKNAKCNVQYGNYSSEKILKNVDVHGNGWWANINAVPQFKTKLFHFEKNVFYNDTESTVFIFKAGFKFKFSSGLFNVKTSATLSKTLRINPGEHAVLDNDNGSVSLHMTAYDHYLYMYDDCVIYMEKYRNSWLDDTYIDQEAKNISLKNINTNAYEVSLLYPEQMDSLTFKKIKNKNGIVPHRYYTKSPMTEVSNEDLKTKVIDNNAQVFCDIEIKKCSGLMITNNTENTKFLIPKGFKITLQTSVAKYINKSTVVGMVVHTTEKVVRKVVTWVTAAVKTMFAWASDKIFRRKQVTEIVEEVPKTEIKYVTKTWVEKIEEQYTETIVTDKNYLINPGGSATIEFTSTHLNYTVVIPKESTIFMAHHIKSTTAALSSVGTMTFDSQNNKILKLTGTEEPLKCNFKILLNEDVSDYITIDNNAGYIYFTTMVDYYDAYDLKTYSAKAKFKLLGTNLKYNELTSIYGSENLFNKLFYLPTAKEDIREYNHNRGMKISVTTTKLTNEDTKQKNTDLSLSVDTTVDESGTISKTFSLDFEKVEIIPENVDTSSNLVVDKKYDVTIAYEDFNTAKKKYVEAVANYLTSLNYSTSSRNATNDGLSLPFTLNPDVLYKLTKIKVKFNYSLYVHPNKSFNFVSNAQISKKNKMVNLLDTVVNAAATPNRKKDIDLLLKYTTFSFSLPISESETIEIKQPEMINNIASTGSGSLFYNLWPLSKSFDLDMTDSGVYYYNGKFYKK